MAMSLIITVLSAYIVKGILGVVVGINSTNKAHAAGFKDLGDNSKS